MFAQKLDSILILLVLVRRMPSVSFMRNAFDHHCSEPGPNALRPDQMTAAERLAEAAEILSRGVVRLRQRREGRPTPLSREPGESWLDFTADQRGHPEDEVDGDRR